MGASVPASRAGDDCGAGDICGRCTRRRRKSGRPDRPTADDHRRAAPALTGLAVRSDAVRRPRHPIWARAANERAANGSIWLYDSPRRSQSAKMRFTQMWQGHFFEANNMTIYTDGSYLEATGSWHVEDSTWKAKNIAMMIRRNRLSPTSVCDVGCGAGEIIRLLSMEFPRTSFVGYDISPQAIALSKQRETQTVSFRQADILQEQVSFDLLLGADVLEHIDDYMGFLRHLKPKANFKIFHIPLDISILSILYGSMIRARQSVGHLHYFTRETALATLRDCGYEIVDSFHTAAFTDRPSRTVAGRIARIPRKILFSLAPKITAKSLGACSLMVLAR
jgi:SAM-dependent methyltransferase